MYEDTLVARYMWEQKSLFPENWAFGNQFYILATPVFSALFYGLTGSMNTGMILATSLMTVLIGISFIWMLKPFAKRSEILVGLLVFLGSVTGPYIVGQIEGQIFFLMASYYAIYLITFLVVLGDYLRERDGFHRRFFNFPLILSMLLCFATGMQSLRQTAVLVLPLLVFEAVSRLAVMIKTRRLPSRTECRRLLRVICISLSNGLGCLVIRLLGIPYMTIFGSLKPQSFFEAAVSLETDLRALRSITGIKYLFGEGTDILAGICGLILVITVLLAIIFYVRRREKDALAVFIGVGIFSIFATLAVNLVIDLSLRSIYLFVWYPVIAVAAVLLLRSCGEVIKTAAIFCLAAVCALNLYVSYYPCVKDAISENTSKSREVANWVQDNGYSLLYGPWSITAAIAVYSDGAFTAGCWMGEPFHAMEYITPLDIYSETHNKNAVYLMIPESRDKALEAATRQGAEMTLRGMAGHYELYTSSKQLMSFDE